MTGSRIEDIIRSRYSCRSYRDIPLSADDRLKLGEFISQKITGPYGSSAVFKFFAAESSDSTELKGLGTYGFIRNPAAFVAGVIKESGMNLEDFGYSMERIVLHASEMGLGTCWLGGSFKRSSFAGKAGLAGDEMLPAVISTGYPADKKTVTDRLIRATAGSDKRKAADELFFSGDGGGLDINYRDGYGLALEMVRLAPSASNKQPWRIVKETGKNRFHFFLERTPGYNRSVKPSGRADLQRVDMGIAMCHFECTAVGTGLKGLWVQESSGAVKTLSGWEYCITWDGV